MHTCKISHSDSVTFLCLINSTEKLCNISPIYASTTNARLPLSYLNGIFTLPVWDINLFCKFLYITPRISQKNKQKQMENRWEFDRGENNKNSYEYLSRQNCLPTQNTHKKKNS